MKKSLLCFLLISLLFTISCCEQKETAQEKQIEIANEEELMEKYGPKDLTEEQVDSIIESIEWETNKNPSILGSKEAQKGGILVLGETSYPPSLRIYGENSNDAFNQNVLGPLMYENLLKIDPITLEFLPGIADKWSITNDKKTFFYHINTLAHWNDNQPITAFDVVATWDLLMDDDLRYPFYQEIAGRYERPVALSSNIVMANPKISQWSLFLYFSQFSMLPEHILSRNSVPEFMDKFNNKPILGSGPYVLEQARTNEIIIVKRNPNWWASNLPVNRGLYNFDRVKFVFYTDRTILDEVLKKGDIDVFTVGIARKWFEDLTPEKVAAIKNNHIIRQRVYTNNPQGIWGYGFNLREEPFNDIRVRKSFCLLNNREEMIKKLFFNEYKLMDSYYSNSIYENKNNPKIRYNPQEAIKLLEEAGYSQKNLNDEGYIVKNGKVFELDLNIFAADTRIQTVFQEELKRIGIKLNLKKVTWAKHSKDMAERNFKIAQIGYTTLLFPNPENMFHSKFADKKNTNNIYGFKNKRVDEICEMYNFEYDLEKRIKLIKELDSLLMSEYLVALNWYSDNLRLLYWNKFGMPEFVLSGITYNGEITSSAAESILAYWWIDKKLEQKLKEVKGKDIKLPGKPAEVNFWSKKK
jgi:microcin C transport system substrate-binding protein